MKTDKSLFKNSIYFIIYRLINVIYPLITATYVSRILKPSGIGEVTFVQNIVIFLVACALLGIPNYGVREISKAQTKKEENKIFSELLAINFISTTIISFCYYSIINFFNININTKLFNIEGIILLLNYFNVDWFYQGKEEFKYITIRSAIVKIFSMITIFIFVKNDSDLCIYALIFALAYAGNYIFNIINLKKYIKLNFENINLKKHIKSIFILAITSISNEIYVTIDTIMLGILTSSDQVGFYGNSMKLIRILINVCTAIGTAMLPRLSKLKKNNNSKIFNEIINRCIKILLWITIPSMLGIILVSDNLVITLFGIDFIPSGDILKVLSLLIVIRTFSNLMLQILVCNSKDDKTSISYFTGMILNVILNFILINFFESAGAAIASVISEFIIFILLFRHAKKEFNFDINLKFILSEIISSIVMIICVFIILKICNNVYVGLFCSIIIGVIVYSLMCFITKNAVILYLLDKFKMKGSIKNVIKS